MAIAFIGAAAANFRVGRPAGFVPEAIVRHRTGGTRDAIRGRFNDPRTAASRPTTWCAATAVSIRRAGPRRRVPRRRRHRADLAAAAPAGEPEPLHHRRRARRRRRGRVPRAARSPPPPRLIADIARRWQFPVTAARVVAHSAYPCVDPLSGRRLPARPACCRWRRATHRRSSSPGSASCGRSRPRACAGTHRRWPRRSPESSRRRPPSPSPGSP